MVNQANNFMKRILIKRNDTNTDTPLFTTSRQYIVVIVGFGTF